MSSVEAGPTARVLLVLDLVQRSPGITAERLAGRLGVTDRAARRYVAILREAGIPVESAPGRYGGYRIGRALRPAPFVFTATEALGLVMAVLDGQHAAADPDDPVGSALGKLIQALPAGVARPAATMRAHARAVPDRGAARPDPSITTDLVSAIAATRRVRLCYRGPSGRGPSGGEWEDIIDPWAVVVRYGRWYLLCRAHRADAVRTLRVDRIRTVHILDETFPPPDDLDPVAVLEDNLGSGWHYPTRVMFDAPFGHVAPHVSAPLGRLEPLDDGARCVLVGSTNDPEAYVGERLARVPYPFRVEGGPELRQAVAMFAARFTDALVPRVDAPE